MSDEPQSLSTDPNLKEQPSARPAIVATNSPSAPASTLEGCLKSGLAVIFRLLLLGVGVTLAWLLGVLIAQWLPSPSTQPPLQEVTLRKTNRILTEIRRLPGRWQAPGIEQTRFEPVPIPTEPIEPLTTPAQDLNDSEKQVIAEELTAIQAELNTLAKRLVDLETRLGRAQSTADVESRLAALQASLATPETADGKASSSNAASTPATSPIPDPDTLPVTVSKEPILQVTDLQVTLPSDALFAPGDARLLETAPLILNTILADLSRYPDATIVLGSHTDDRMEVSTSRELAFKQADALQAYLAANLPGQPHWVTVGYGQSQPLTDNQSPESRQRNRRIEILVDR